MILILQIPPNFARRMGYQYGMRDPHEPMPGRQHLSWVDLRRSAPLLPVVSRLHPMPADPRVVADLARNGIEYEEMECDPDLADTAQFCEAYGIPIEQSANAILVASRKPEGHNAICLVLANTRLDVNGTVRRRLGVRKVSFASGDLTRDLTGQEIGGVTVFGTHSGVPVWVDSRVLDHPWV